jgi:hypothetical protein
VISEALNYDMFFKDPSNLMVLPIAACYCKHNRQIPSSPTPCLAAKQVEDDSLHASCSEARNYSTRLATITKFI